MLFHLALFLLLSSRLLLPSISLNGKRVLERTNCSTLAVGREMLNEKTKEESSIAEGE